MRKHVALGPNGSWKTGQRVPVSGLYVDQHGVHSWHGAGDTFPPTVGFRGEGGEIAFRRLVQAAVTA